MIIDRRYYYFRSIFVLILTTMWTIPNFLLYCERVTGDCRLFLETFNITCNLQLAICNKINEKAPFLLLLLVPALAQPQETTNIFASWTFDENKPSYEITGKGKFIPGVVGKGYKFDGFSSYLEDKSFVETDMPRSFSIEAWVSLGAYPWNWAPIVTIGKYKITGFYFGVDSRGRIGFQLSDTTWT